MITRQAFLGSKGRGAGMTPRATAVGHKTASRLRGDGLHLNNPLGIRQAADDNPSRCRCVARFQVLLTVRPHVLQSVRVGRIDVQANNVFRTHSSIGENCERVLPDLFVLRLEPIGNGSVGSDANLPCCKEPTRVWRYFHAMAVLGGWRCDSRGIARLQHGTDSPSMAVSCAAAGPDAWHRTIASPGCLQRCSIGEVS